MRAGWIYLLLLASAACAPREAEDAEAPPAAPVPADAVASWRDVSLSIAEVELQLPEQRTPACREMRGGAGGLDEVVPCYREVAEGIALERLVMAEIGDPDQAIEELADEDVELRRHALLDAFHASLQEEVEEPTAEEVEAYYAAHREDFRRPGQLTLWNIFRRHDDPADPEATVAFLRELKAHVEAGENFATLAREHSHSETRLRDGLVGQVVEGELDPLMEEVAFALGDGEVSEPVRVKGGAVLLQVRQASPGAELTLDQVGGQVWQGLLAERLRELVVARREGLKPPDGAVVLEADELFAALDGEDLERTVFEIAGERFDVEEMRAALGLREVDAVADLADGEREGLYAGYRQLVGRQLLYLDLLESDDPAEAELRAEAEEHVREQLLSGLVDGRLREEMEAGVAESTEELRAYFDDNRALFQGPPRFELTVWELPFDEEPALQLARMEELRAALEAGELELAAAAGELGGSVTDHGWAALYELPRELPAKAVDLLLQTEAGGYCDPFQQDEALHLLWVRGREEPRQLEFEEALEEVEWRYLERFEQRLYDELVERRLEAAGFRFYEETVRRLLGGGELGEPAADSVEAPAGDSMG